jgi:hypothetical protein
MTKSILTVIALLVCSTAQAKDINTNTKPVVIYEETFEVYCEHRKTETICFEIVTSGAHKGEFKMYTGPASILAKD